MGNGAGRAHSRPVGPPALLARKPRGSPRQEVKIVAAAAVDAFSALALIRRMGGRRAGRLRAFPTRPSRRFSGPTAEGWLGRTLANGLALPEDGGLSSYLARLLAQLIDPPPRGAGFVQFNSSGEIAVTIRLPSVPLRFGIELRST